MDTQNLQRNVLGSCEKPVKVFNRYLCDYVYVPCGRCPACLLRKGGINSLLCSFEELEAQYTYFITLTYSDDYLPIMLPRYEVADIVFVDCETSDELFTLPNNHENRLMVEKAISTANLPIHGLSYCNKRDIELFFKRFRKNANKISHTPLRYYCVCEYGPTRYRVHWHILLFLDCERQAAAISELLLKSWKFGFVDYSLSRGKCNTYVAQYVNSFSNLPSLYAVKCIRPRSFHSKSFGLAYFRRNKKEIYEKGLEYFNYALVEAGGRYTYLSLVGRSKYLLFPRCYAFGTTGTLCHRFMYQLLRYFCIEFGCQSWPAKYLVDIIFKHELSALTASQRTFIDRLFFNVKGDRWKFDKDYCFSLLSRFFALSAHFYLFCCDSDWSKADEVQQVIEKFYKDLDNQNLVNWYASLEDYTSMYQTSLEVFYNENLDSDNYGKDNPVYMSLLDLKLKRFDASTKTKRLNDNNNLI